MAQKGRRFENEVAKEVTRSTGDECMVWPAGYSGNNAIPSPDLIGVTPHGAKALELKKWSRDTDGVAESDLQQLLRVQKNYLDVALLIDFSHREPLIVEPAAPSLDAFAVDDDLAAVENFKPNAPDAFDPRITDGPAGEDAELRFSKPSTNEWPSATAGKDAVMKIREWMGVPAADA